jgi:putative FmdB family regulatory protein
MPIYEIACQDCCQINEVIVSGSDAQIVCPSCGSTRTEKLMSATSSLTGRTGQSLPGAGDTSCCGSSPSGAGCAGPGSCCGKLG